MCSMIARRSLRGVRGRIAALFAVLFTRRMVAGVRRVTEAAERTDNIAHDLRSPITRIRGMAETTITGAQTVAEYRETTCVIIEECDRLVHLINTMLAISEAESGAASLQRDTMDMAILVADVHEMFEPVAAEKNVRLLVEGASDPVSIIADARQLQRALANLVDNAIKFTPPCGTVAMRLFVADGLVKLCVEDTGAGIAADDLPRIFDRYYRADRSRGTTGNGLGLSLARAIVRAHGGDITVISSLGSGSRFTLALPLESTTSTA